MSSSSMKRVELPGLPVNPPSAAPRTLPVTAPAAQVLPAPSSPMRRGGWIDPLLSRSAVLSAVAGAVCAVLGDPLWLTAWFSIVAVCLGGVVLRREPGRLGGQLALSVGISLLVFWAMLRVIAWLSGYDFFVWPTLTRPT